MRVVVDGRRLQDHPLGGVGRHVAEVLRRLVPLFDVLTLIDARRPRPDLGLDLEVVAIEGPPRAPELAWLETGVATWLRHNGGLFHGTFNAVPLSYGGPVTMTLHDLAPQRHPEEFRFLKRTAWRIYARNGVRRSPRLVTVSEFMREEIGRHFSIDPARIAVAPNSASPRFTPERSRDAPTVLQRRGCEAQPYVVAMGGARRRALDVAVSAWQLARIQSDLVPALVVVGAERPPMLPGVEWLGVVDDDEWPALLAGAKAFLYPTRYEGYGLPAHEAIAAGTPVICAAVASLPEVLGDAGVFCSAPTAPALADGLLRLLDDHELANWAAARGLERARSLPTWDDTAVVVADVWESQGATRRLSDASDSSWRKP
jgi:glycosyltransferase involved in cell wall biosynthesis